MSARYFQAIEGPIATELILSGFQDSALPGARVCFLGTIRADTVDGNVVAGIEYTMHEDMVATEIERICAQLVSEYELISIRVLHSIGKVSAGEASLLVTVESKHRAASFTALQSCVDEIKSKAPIWGKEFFLDGSHQWKQNL